MSADHGRPNYHVLQFVKLCRSDEALQGLGSTIPEKPNAVVKPGTNCTHALSLVHFGCTSSELALERFEK